MPTLITPVYVILRGLQIAQLCRVLGGEQKCPTCGSELVRSINAVFLTRMSVANLSHALPIPEPAH